jgi:hypothetical protein
MAVKEVKEMKNCGTSTALPKPGAEAATRCYEVKNRGGRENCSPAVVCDYGGGTFDGSGPIDRGQAKKFCCPSQNAGRDLAEISIQCQLSDPPKECTFSYKPVENSGCFEAGVLAGEAAGGVCEPQAACTNGPGKDLGKHDCQGEFATCCSK